jgi:hypothetical protein
LDRSIEHAIFDVKRVVGGLVDPVDPGLKSRAEATKPLRGSHEVAEGGWGTDG